MTASKFLNSSKRNTRTAECFSRISSCSLGNIKFSYSKKKKQQKKTAGATETSKTHLFLVHPFQIVVGNLVNFLQIIRLLFFPSLLLLKRLITCGWLKKRTGIKPIFCSSIRPVLAQEFSSHVFVGLLQIVEVSHQFFFCLLCLVSFSFHFSEKQPAVLYSFRVFFPLLRVLLRLWKETCQAHCSLRTQ